MEYELPDGTGLPLPDGASGADAAAAIGSGLARAALAVRVDGELLDLARALPAPDDGVAPKLEILTERSGDDALALVRHDAAHVLAAAMLDLYPGVKISIGPAIDGGFYYDFEFPDGVVVNDEAFPAIEAAMKAHIDADEPFEREDVPVAEALERFRGEDQPYKVELIEDLIRDADPGDPLTTVSLYTNGPFTDLCRGPHAPS
ncbi:MAG: TGS domain-containing protein, partial [Solirubrobacteraceae bacterium]